MADEKLIYWLLQSRQIVIMDWGPTFEGMTRHACAVGWSLTGQSGSWQKMSVCPVPPNPIWEEMSGRYADAEVQEIPYRPKLWEKQAAAFAFAAQTAEAAGGTEGS